MTLHGIDLIAIAVMIAGGLTGCYLLLWRRLRTTLVDRHMKMADQVGALDEAIRALEARLAEQPARTSLPERPNGVGTVESASDFEGVGEIAPELQAVIAAAAVAAVGPDAVVHSIKPVPSPWTQQGRVLVQGGHNLRVRR